ncbi:fibronectin type III domain-containing protein [Nocardioides sp. CPCC 205120]|uniref:fibronectin type III domain-containing protein n=1 Tax=Nocardioides sp. CPCC 205120 TaxID=3406462 RepID=UPI003B5055F6
MTTRPRHALTRVAALSVSLTATLATGLAATTAIAPAAGAATAVIPPRPSYVDFDTLLIPTVEGVRYLDERGRALTGEVDLPAADDEGYRRLVVTAAPTRGYALAPHGWEEYDSRTGRASDYFTTQQGSDLLTVATDGCVVAIRNERDHPVELAYAEGGLLIALAVPQQMRERLEASDSQLAHEAGSGEAEGETEYWDYEDYFETVVLQPGGAFTVTSAWTSVDFLAQHPEDTSEPTIDSVDTFECGVGEGTQTSRVGVAGCELTFVPPHGRYLQMGEVFYRDADGNRSLDGVEITDYEPIDPDWFDEWMGDAPVTFDFSGVGGEDIEVFWSEFSIEERDHFGDSLAYYVGSTTVCDGSPAATRPATPATPVVRSTTTGDVTLTWGRVADGGSPVTEYVVHQTGVGGSRWFTVPGDLGRVTMRGQTAGTHSFRVYAANRMGNSAGSPVVTTNVVRPPAAPALPGVRVRGNDVTVGWAPPRNTGGFPVTGYVVQHGNRYVAVPASTRELTFRGLGRGNHYFRVYAANRLGNSAGSPVRLVTLR